MTSELALDGPSPGAYKGTAEIFFIKSISSEDLLMLTPVGCRGRVARLCAALDNSLDGALISRPEHVFYFSNLYPQPNSLNLDSSSYLLIRPNGSTTLFTDNWLAPSAEVAADEIIVIEWYSMKEPARDRRYAVANAVASHLRAAGFRTLGAETAILPALIARVAGELVDVNSLISSLREIKDPDELEAIRLAIRTAEAVHEASRDLLSPGIREIDYYASLLEEATRRVERPFIMMCDLVSGERAVAGGGPPSTRVMQEGGLVILDFFPCVEGYRGDITNTLSVGGSPGVEQREAFARVQSALEAGEKKLRPGTPVSEIFESMSSVLSGGGEFRPLSHHGGHAIGLGHPESPHIVPKSDRVLTAGMVMSLEPGLYDASFGGIRLEHNYLITASGFERLSRQELGLT